MGASNPRILFLGTPSFAVASLQALCEAGLAPVAVVTAPDKPAGRGQKLQQSAVKEFAVANGLPVLQPTNLKSPAFQQQLTDLALDLGIVVAFRMLPEAVWSLPKLGTFNLHASLLPAYRGAAPINWAVINGEAETGVTTFLLQHEIDTGQLLLVERTAIGSNETAGELHDRLMALGAPLVVETANGLLQGSLEGRPQQVTGKEPHAPKLSKELCRIPFGQAAEQVHHHIMGLSPHPGAFALLDEEPFKIYRTRQSFVSETPGAGKLMVMEGKLFVGCQTGLLELLEIQAAGRKRMAAADFLRGANIDGKMLL